MKKDSRMVEELISIEELCRILKLKKSYVYLLTHQKKIPHYKINGQLRFRLSDIELWLKKHFIEDNEINLIDF